MTSSTQTGSSGEDVGGGWLPIASAPKDGTHVLVCFAEPPFHTLWTFQQRPATVAHFWEGEGAPDRGWYLSVCWYEQDDPMTTPTHWQPLPEPPSPSQDTKD